MVKKKALISFAVTAKLICVFVFAYAKIRFSHVAAHIILDNNTTDQTAQMHKLIFPFCKLHKLKSGIHLLRLIYSCVRDKAVFTTSFKKSIIVLKVS